MFDIKPRILCVDDDMDVLDGFKQNLRRQFNLHIATGGEEALAKLQEHTFEVILSDMRMPGMDGATFFHKSRKLAPNSVRILLTGQCDLDSAISAVNNGQIFRFLTKPCASKELQSILDSAVKQYRLVTAEKDLLQKTLKGSIKVLTEALSITSPLAFGTAKRLYTRVARVCLALGIKDSWHIEIASMLSQLGAISLSDEIIEKYYSGQQLAASELEEMQKMHGFTRQLLENIPRLEKVVQLLDEVDAQKGSASASLSLPGQVLSFAQDLEQLELKGKETSFSIATIAGRGERYSSDVIESFRICFANDARVNKILEIQTTGLKPGMVVAENIYMSTGALLVARGFEITEGFVAKVQKFNKGFLREPLRVIISENSNEESS